MHSRKPAFLSYLQREKGEGQRWPAWIHQPFFALGVTMMPGVPKRRVFMLTARGQPQRLANCLENAESKLASAPIMPRMPMNVRGGTLWVGYGDPTDNTRNASANVMLRASV
jgi:hypothetical protein